MVTKAVFSGDECWSITLRPLPRTPGKSWGKQIREKAFGTLHQVCWGSFKQYPIPLAIQWNENKEVGMRCWPRKQKGHCKISSLTAHCKVPMLTHFQLKKTHQQVSRTGNWNILSPAALQNMWSQNGMVANWETWHSGFSPSSFSYIHQINLCASCHALSLRYSEDVDNKGHEEGAYMQNTVGQYDLCFVKKKSKL